jgi:molybdopterin-guanine dinucleotide biosynthesis protein A
VTLSAVLMAGGRSTRMGSDKALLEFEGEPLWRRQIRILIELQPQDVFVSARTAPAWLPDSMTVVCDEAPSRGPLSGLVAVLRRIETSHVLVLAIDLPKMTSDRLRRLWSRAQPGIGVIPDRNGTYEPLAAVYPREALPEAEAALRAGTLSLQPLLRELLARGRLITDPVEPEEARLFLNVNAPADLAR